jgi:predicted lipoprotein with Yx(FWY)xxD motif
MKKSAQAGFSVLETLLLIVMVGLVAFIVWYVFHASSDTNATLDNATNTSNKAATKQLRATASSAKIIITKNNASSGNYLTEVSGKTLYTYGADTSGVSNCKGSCSIAWPAYKASSKANLPTNVTVIERPDNTMQYAYKGMPLYYYASESTGQVTGDGINNFHVARP